MEELLTFNYTIPGDDFTRAGEASSSVKNKLKKTLYKYQQNK